MNQFWKLSPLVLVVGSCLDEGRFGKFDQAQVLAFGVEGEIAPAQILTDEHTIQVSLPSDNDGEDVTITSLTVSSLATTSRKVGDVIDISEDFALVVTAEDGSKVDWIIERVASGGGGMAGSSGMGGGGEDCPSPVLTYSISGLFEVSDTPANAGNGQFTIGPGSMKLRASPDGWGSYRMTILEYRLPQYFVVNAPGAVTTTDLQVTTVYDECGLAHGSLSKTSLVWDNCDYGPAPPHGTTKWTPADVLGGPGCLDGYHVQGTVTCAGAFCSASGVDFPLDVDDNYPQPLNTFLFSEDLTTFSMRAQGGPPEGVGHNGVEVPSAEPSRTWLGLDGTLMDVECAPEPVCD